jgi:hypothetical protein
MDASDGDLDRLWQAVLEAWGDRARHDAFLSACHGSGRLGAAASRYRGVLEDPERRELANKRLGAIALLATQTLETDRTQPRRKLPRWLLWAAASTAASAIAWLIYALSQ